jgi:dolichyl-diphosphooligosaccharide--protein glycosyltransferase
MTDDGRIADLLADRPDLESPLAALLAVDEDAETWIFDDVPVDSGAFGELVARGVVEKTDDEYRLADPGAVRRALADEPTSATASEADSRVTSPDASTSEVAISFPQIDVPISLPQIDVRAAGLLGTALVFVALVRSFVVSAVFRGEHVVLSGNDPYYYLYWVERSFTAGESAQLPSGITKGEPLLVATLARFTGIFGGADAAGAVLAVYPVLSAVLTGVFLYWLTHRLTADRRIALTAVVVLAVMPGHALRTALGFADHHAFDYIWLALTAASLVALTGDSRTEQLSRPGTWLAALALGVGVGAQTLAWDNGALMIVPVGVVVAARVLLDIRSERSPGIANAPVLGGLGLAVLIVRFGHRSLGWHTDVVATAPLLLLAGATTLVVVAEFAFRLGRGGAELALAEGVVTLAGGWFVWRTYPEFRTELLGGLDRIFRSDDIVEVGPLIEGETLPFLLLFGFFLFLAVPVLVWATRWTLADARWTVPCSYGWYFLGLSLVQVRFTGQLGIFITPFAAVAFVWLAARIDLTQEPALPAGTPTEEFSAWVPDRPDASTVLAVLLLFALLGGLGLLQSAIKVQQVTTDDADYDTAVSLAEYAEERGWESRSDSYVFTEWGKNRLYNYFVNGNSQSYSYAQANYIDFMTQTDPATASPGGRVRFIVTQDRDPPPETMHARLHEHLGSRNGDIAGLARYRAIYTTPDGARKAFVVVPGATIRGTTGANASVTARTDVSVPGRSFTYERRTLANGTGAYSVTVAHPGRYTIRTANGTAIVTVPESAVMNGTTVGVQ